MEYIRNSTRTLMIAALMLVIMLSSSTFANAAGCSDWYRISTGTAYCTSQQCPGGLHRKLRDDTYEKKCVRDNGSIYYQTKIENVYVNCSCT